MKIIISLGTKRLELEPETQFEKEVMRKYFQDSTVEGISHKDGKLSIKFSGPASHKGV